LIKEIPGDLNDEQKEYVQDIYNNSFLLLNAVNSLLTITKSEAGFQKLNLGSYNIRDIVEGVVVRVDSVAISKGSQIIVDIPEDLPIVYCDRYKIEQVLYNLLDNAMKFTYNGTITISVRELPDRTVKVAVADTGVGIKEKNQAKVFDKFFTEKTPLNPGGSGLGLTVVKEIVSLHNGRVWLESQDGEGTTVSFVIPNKISGKADEKKELSSRARVCK
jgi:signal transduction histidine kinase